MLRVIGQACMYTFMLSDTVMWSGKSMASQSGMYSFGMGGEAVTGGTSWKTMSHLTFTVLPLLFWFGTHIR